MNYKHILPIEINYALKHLKDSAKNCIPDVNANDLNHKKRVFFLDTPAYENIGDQAIAFAMEVFIAEVLPDYKQIEITEDKLPATLKWLRKTIRPDDIICLTGGGNMGIMYQRYEAVRRLVMKNFSQNPIIVFPQTFDYGLSRYAARELKRAKKIYGNVKRLVLCARDEESYHQMHDNFKNARVILCPDIVLYLDYRNAFQKSNEVGACFRKDRERILNEKQMKTIEQSYPDAKVISTLDDIDIPISLKNRKNVVERKLKEFGTKKLILTDRLHGMIFSFITNTPCIAFPNSNGKVERVCNYLSDRGNIVFTKTEIVPVMVAEKDNETMRLNFGELVNVIKSIARV